MKYLKYTFLTVMVLIVVLVVIVFLQPNSYDVKRTQTINAPVGQVFSAVNEYRTWESWGPWFDEDSTIVTTYPEKTSGVGGSYSWTSKDGPGKIETVELVPNKSINQVMQFGDFEPTDVYWQFAEAGAGTEVTWGMRSEKNPFMFKLIGLLSGGMDNLLGEMMNKGLTKMNKVMSETTLSSGFRLGDIQQVDAAEQFFVGFSVKSSTDVDMVEMKKLYAEYLPKSIEYAISKGVQEFVPGTVFTKWDEQTKEAEFVIGALTKTKVEAGEGMQDIVIAATKVLNITKYGPYGTGDKEAHEAIAKNMQENNLEVSADYIWETYPNDPEKVAAQDIETVIFYPIK